MPLIGRKCIILKNTIMKDYRKLFEQIRTEINSDIIAIFNKHNVDNEYQEIGVYATNTPIVREDAYDDNLTFTLDSIGVRNGEVFFGGSSCVDNITIWTSKIDIELLVDIYEWLIENEEEIFEEM